ncbi:hypothetical protein CI610_02764 [invertebrate metagenome]|uniref:Uncharacterized protein n=1 Tax=invertebrate metagenome TaxID=1711999 RepID=A0A2H9T529_9ZZZZ
MSLCRVLLSVKSTLICEILTLVEAALPEGWIIPKKLPYYKNERVAKGRATMLAKKGQMYEAVPYQQGFALKPVTTVTEGNNNERMEDTGRPAGVAEGAVGVLQQDQGLTQEDTSRHVGRRNRSTGTSRSNIQSSSVQRPRSSEATSGSGVRAPARTKEQEESSQKDHINEQVRFIEDEVGYTVAEGIKRLFHSAESFGNKILDGLADEVYFAAERDIARGVPQYEAQVKALYTFVKATWGASDARKAAQLFLLMQHLKSRAYTKNSLALSQRERPIRGFLVWGIFQV